MVLHRHRLLGTWVAPGGHIDAGEHPWQAAVREDRRGDRPAASRPGQRFVGPRSRRRPYPGPRGHTHLDLRYLVDGDDADPAPPPDESQEVFWFSWAEALQIAEPSMTGILTHLWRTP